MLAENQGAICRQISRPAAERFTGFGLHESAEGAVFLKDAMTWLNCSSETAASALEPSDEAVSQSWGG
ncbi:hypothetical protein ACFVKB_38950 [Rhodococcus sp. NPDC127530]|uniref:hypothetical protein n=1 Tax=unclassified Rhodococcus (in: high G+C Gram-positive bacteria) TaxID=192944 RepID=UPI00362916BF